MGYKLCSVLAIIFCFIQKSRLNKLIMEKEELNESNKKLEWNHFKEQTVNRNLHYICILSTKKDEIRDYFRRQNISKVAVYGMDAVGRAAVRLLIDAGIAVGYGIDRNRNIVCDDIEIRQAEQIDDQMDIIIVAAEIYFREIKNVVGDKSAVCKLSEIFEEILLTSHDYG